MSWDPVPVTMHTLAEAHDWVGDEFDINSTSFVAAYAWDKTKKDHLCFTPLKPAAGNKRQRRQGR